MSWRKTAKRIAAPLAAAVPSRTTGTPGAILCYHGVGLRAAPEVVAVDAFNRQLDLLMRRYRVVGIGELIQQIGRPDDGGPLRVAITFDDGYKGVIDAALPGLIERGLHATAYVLPGLWGCTAPWLSDAPTSERTLWEQADAEKWVAADMGLGSHGSTHIDLSGVPRSVIDREVTGSKQMLEEAFGPVEGFCYPWGRSSDIARRSVEAAGYRYALAGGYIRHHDPSDLLSLGRITVDYDDRVEDLDMKLRGGYDWLDVVGRFRSRVSTWRSS